MSPGSTTRMGVALRALAGGDRDRILEMMKDVEAVRMAAFTADDPTIGRLSMPGLPVSFPILIPSTG